MILYQILFSPQVKWSVIISNKHSVYDLPHESPKDVRPSILGNYERPEKSQNFIL